MAISSDYIGGYLWLFYWWLLVAILLMHIGGYSINWWLFLLMPIGGYFINAYWWLFY